MRILDVPPRPLAPLPLADYRVSENPVLIYEYKPNHAGEEGFRINSAGFRDHEYPINKPPGVYRVIALGDSTTAGLGVERIADTYPKRLERLLNDGAAQDIRYEVLNMGVGGYHTLQEVETLRTKGLSYRPDFVLLLVCLNDFDLDADGGIYEMVKNGGDFGHGRPNRSALGLLLGSSRLAFILYHRLWWRKNDHERWYWKHVLRGATTVKSGLALLSDLQRQAGFVAHVAILPEFHFPFDGYRAYPIHERVRRAADGLPGIQIIELLDHLKEIDNHAPVFSYDGVHLNEYGHDTVARILAPLIKTAAAGSGHVLSERTDQYSEPVIH